MATQLPRRTITPPNSTTREQVVDALFPNWDAIAAAIEPAALRQSPAMWPWLAAHWQIGQFDRYFDDPRDLLANGLPWLRERGSAASVRRAMGWLGYSSIKIEEDGPRLHINPGAEVSLADLRRIAHVVRASVPLHVRFYRLFYRYDRRRIRLDARPGLDNGLLGRDSGVPVDIDDETVLASQGQIFGVVVERDNNNAVQTQESVSWSYTVRRREPMRLDSWRLDSRLRAPGAQLSSITCSADLPAFSRRPTEVDTNNTESMEVPPLNAQVQDMHSPTYSVYVQRTQPARTWTGTWDSRPWQENEVITQYTEEPTP